METDNSHGRYQPIYDIAELLYRKGIRRAVLCPGSRCAPLTLAFTRHPGIQCFTISDERSAGFIALGMAQQTKTAVAIICTSGSAVYNLAPAVAEAFFQQVPLLVLTADRPSEWIDQLDGQTIRQRNIYAQHVKKFFELPQEYEHRDNVWHINRVVNEAANLSVEIPNGPVHINAPFREPLYPGINDQLSYSKEVRVIQSVEGTLALTDSILNQLRKELNETKKILVVSGQNDSDPENQQPLEGFLSSHQVPLVGDILSNLHGLNETIRCADLFLGQMPERLKENLVPDLLITYGKSLLSKNLKTFLRTHPPKSHWHFQPGGEVADTLQHLTKVIRCTPARFFSSMSTDHQPSPENKSGYLQLWKNAQQSAHQLLSEFLKEQPLTEIKFLSEIFENLPSPCNLHLANSMAVRYASLIGLNSLHDKVSVYSNRGTSGIDGCSSTAVGHALSSDIPNVLITGDMAFLYDRNAFWHNYPMPGLKIVVLNNHGGIIFKMIDGPAGLPEADEYFVTRQKLGAQYLCKEFDFKYYKPDPGKKLRDQILDFFMMDGSTKVFELEAGQEENLENFTLLKNIMKKHYET